MLKNKGKDYIHFRVVNWIFMLGSEGLKIYRLKEKQNKLFELNRWRGKSKV